MPHAAVAADVVQPHDVLVASAAATGLRRRSPCPTSAAMRANSSSRSSLARACGSTPALWHRSRAIFGPTPYRYVKRDHRRTIVRDVNTQQTRHVTYSTRLEVTLLFTTAKTTMRNDLLRWQATATRTLPSSPGAACGADCCKRRKSRRGGGRSCNVSQIRLTLARTFMTGHSQSLGQTLFLAPFLLGSQNEAKYFSISHRGRFSSRPPAKKILAAWPSGMLLLPLSGYATSERDGTSNLHGTIIASTSSLRSARPSARRAPTR